MFGLNGLGAVYGCFLTHQSVNYGLGVFLLGVSFRCFLNRVFLCLLLWLCWRWLLLLLCLYNYHLALLLNLRFRNSRHNALLVSDDLLFAFTRNELTAKPVEEIVDIKELPCFLHVELKSLVVAGVICGQLRECQRLLPVFFSL